MVGKVERELREPAAKGAEKRDARESRGEGGEGCEPPSGVDTVLIPC